MRKKTIINFLVIVFIIIVVVFIIFLSRKDSAQKLLNSVVYSCNEGKTIDAKYYDSGIETNITPGEAPIPSGFIKIKLSDGRNMTLPQTISADGARYADNNESFVFWSKGDGALVLENGIENNYKNCIIKTQNIFSNYKNGTYTIAGQPITLVNGLSETEAAPGSESKITTKYFGNEAIGDINGDGLNDIAFLITQSTGGSGTFYYVVAAIKADGGFIGTDAVLLGDRIAPQTTEIRDGELIVNYADRNPGEPMTAAPSLGKSLFLKLDPQTMQFGIVVQNFEGEADPSIMTLGMKTWDWISATYNDGTKIVPVKTGRFTITFNKNGMFSATTDCNSISGNYTENKGALSFTKMASTLMYCEGSQESDFQKLLENTQSYIFTTKGQLILELKYDSGSVAFN